MAVDWDYGSDEAKLKTREVTAEFRREQAARTDPCTVDIAPNKEMA
jgi:hypothetical protein